jgi:hypothetical protein
MPHDLPLTPASGNLIPSPPCHNVGDVNSWKTYFKGVYNYTQSKSAEAQLQAEVSRCVKSHKNCYTAGTSDVHPPCIAFMQWASSPAASGDSSSFSDMAQHFTRGCNQCMFSGQGCQDAYNLMNMAMALMESGVGPNSTPNASQIKTLLKNLVKYGCKGSSTAPIDHMSAADLNSLSSYVNALGNGGGGGGDGDDIWKWLGPVLGVVGVIIILAILYGWWTKKGGKEWWAQRGARKGSVKVSVPRGTPTITRVERISPLRQ